MMQLRGPRKVATAENDTAENDLVCCETRLPATTNFPFQKFPSTHKHPAKTTRPLMPVVGSIHPRSASMHERTSAKDTVDPSISTAQVNAAKSLSNPDPSGTGLLRRRSSSGLLEDDCFRRARTMCTLDIAVSTTTPRASSALKSSSVCSPRLTQDSMSKSLVEYSWLPPDQDPRHLMLLSRSNHDDEDNNQAGHAYNVIESQRQELLLLARLEASRSKLRLPNNVSSARTSTRSETALCGVNPLRCSGMTHTHIPPMLDTSVKHVKAIRV